MEIADVISMVSIIKITPEGALDNVTNIAIIVTMRLHVFHVQIIGSRKETFVSVNRLEF